MAKAKVQRRRPAEQPGTAARATGGSVSGGSDRPARVGPSGAAPAPEELEAALRQFDAQRREAGADAAGPERDGYWPPASDRWQLVRGEEAGPPAGPVGMEQIQEAQRVLEEYRKGKASLDERIIQNERWFKLHNALHARHDDNAMQADRKQERAEQMPDSPWLFNSLLNKHADAMDNYPEPNVLPRAKDDVATARQISSVLPAVLEQAHYQALWDSKWWYKLKHGFAVTMVTWDGEALGGMGEVSVKLRDVLNLFWEPGVSDIQDSRNLFNVELMDEEELHRRWPWTKQIRADNGSKVQHYLYEDTVDHTRKVSVIDWYYKRAGRVHYCKFVDGAVLYASENDPDYAQRGFYDHGLYPFVVDNMFPVAGSPCGFGYIDLMKGTQGMLDSLRRATVDHAVRASLTRWFCREDGGVNEDEFGDLRKHFVHTQGGLGEESLRPIELPPLDGINVTVMNNLIDEMKETSGNRDFAQGGTTSGITAASAIAALQEAGSKPSRDMLNASYRAFERECELCIELMRQFYRTERYFRVTGEGGQEEFVPFDNSGMVMQPYSDAPGGRLPVFDIKVSASRKSTFSALAQNELAKELYGMGIFDPGNADRALAVLEMMTFEGKDKVEERVRANGTMFEQLQQLQDAMVKLGTIADSLTGTQMTPDMVQAFQAQLAALAQGGAGSAAARSGAGGSTVVNALGRATSGRDQATRARQNAMQATAPGGERR